MKSHLTKFVLFLILLTACHKPEDEVVPVPPDSEATPTELPLPAGDGGTHSHAAGDSAYFKYGSYKGLPFRYLTPPEGDVPVAFPMLVFLHGMGERGDDNEEQIRIGGSYFLPDSIRSLYPAYIVYPQCPSNAYWFDKEIIALVKDLTDSLQRVFPVDPKRISIGGFSMGAYGTFEITSRYPGFFEAAVAISGDGDDSKAALMAQSRWRVFAGGRDEVVPSSRSRQMANALQRAGASVAFTLYQQADHHRTWVYAFSEPDLFKWLFGDDTPTAMTPFSARDSIRTDHTGISSGSSAM